VWIQLDAASIQSYCHDHSGDAWCLVSSSSDDNDVFLRAKSDLAAAESHQLPFTYHTSPTTRKGFDFTTASKTPTFSQFATSTQMPGLFNSVFLLPAHVAVVMNLAI